MINGKPVEGQDFVTSIGTTMKAVLDRTLNNEHGQPGNFAHVYAAMLRAYHTGLALTGRQFEDTDAFAIMELSELARQSVSPAVKDGKFAVNAATWATLKASYSQPVHSVGEQKPNSAEDAADAAYWDRQANIGKRVEMGALGLPDDHPAVKKMQEVLGEEKPATEAPTGLPTTRGLVPEGSLRRNDNKPSVGTPK